ncbi:hypothetical protein [Streptomyces radicis]|uniref:Secreted protein n=1 Tax=Streptomyces radicis TaxID=1750517 RepID=A0A3A9W2Z6_9ACTN|nr:hypothetical protein [Streptomyces radicis]RKN07635.1 hypothetical protein D7319_18435 [Streptomyces radicis]RKN18358.1 hypothetical protein D7318_22670 [Streptomyces radicis]
MDLRDSKSRLILIVAALGAALVIAVASCSGGGDGDGDEGATGQESGQDTENGDGEDTGGEPTDDGEGEAPQGEPLAQVTGEQEITLTINDARREAGGFLTVEGTLTNGGGEPWGDGAWAGAERELAGNDFSMAGASLVAQEEGRRYLILRDTEGRCLCTNFGLLINSGDTVNWFAQFPEPEAETTEVDFNIGQLPPATIQIR